MSFQVPATTAAAPATGGFSFGLATNAAGAKQPTFAAATKPLTFGTPVAGIGGFGSAPAPAVGATAPTQAVAPLGGFGGFGAPTATTAATLPTLSGFGTATAPAQGLGGFGTATAPAQGLGGFGAPNVAAPAPTTAASALPTLTGFNMPAANTAAAPTLGVGGFGTTTATAAPKTTLPVLTGFGAAPATSTTAAGGFSLAKTTAAPTIGLGLGAPTSAAPAPTSIAGVGSGGFANLTTATKTTDSASVVNPSQMTYNQLEEHINKWTLELEEQEKVFTEQATQINAWDKVLINNNQKILELNDAVQKVKNDQQMLEQELEFIATQHKELEESISPLQKEFLKIPQVDVERSQTYLMVENLDTQLKQMSEDLKEIIDNLNESNKGQDNSDPIIQIGKILNAHMSSLQWIETSSSNITNKLEDINKMHESFKRDSERSFRSAYYN